MWVTYVRDFKANRLREGFGRIDAFVATHLVRIERAKAEWEREHPKNNPEAVVKKDVKLFLSNDHPQWTRALLENMAEFPNVDNIKPLLTFIPTIPADDTHLKYAARLALRNSLQRIDDWSKADIPHNNPVVADVALGIPTERSAKYLAEAYKEMVLPRNRDAELAEFIGRRGSQLIWSSVFQSTRATKIDQLRAAEALLRGAQAAGATHAKGVIRGELENAFLNIDRKNPVESRAVVAVLRQASGLIADPTVRGVDPFAKLCEEWAVNSNTDTGLRAEALDVMAAYGPIQAREIARGLIADTRTPAILRERSATVLGSSRAIVDQAVLTDAFKTAPYKLSLGIATGLARDRVGAVLLFAAVKAGQASPRLLQEKPVLDALKAAKVENANARVAELTKGLPSPDARLSAIMKSRAAGFAKAKPDIAAGKLVFAKTCAACHQIANEGGKVAPNLDGVGIRGVDRLLEDVLDPNRNVDANFRASPNRWRRVRDRRSGRERDSPAKRGRGQANAFDDFAHARRRRG
jgi:hypothetical protein